MSVAEQEKEACQLSGFPKGLLDNTQGKPYLQRWKNKRGNGPTGLGRRGQWKWVKAIVVKAYTSVNSDLNLPSLEVIIRTSLPHRIAVIGPRCFASGKKWPYKQHDDLHIIRWKSKM